MATFNSYFLNNTPESNINWFNSIPNVTNVDSANIIGTLAYINNADGSRTVFHADIAGFSYDANGRLQGTIRWITHSTSSGAEFSAFGSISDYINVDMTTFLLSDAQTRYDLVFNRPTNTINGDAGDNLLGGGNGADAFVGGFGADTVTYANASGPVTVDLTGFFANAGEAAGDTFNSIEYLIGSDDAAGDQLFADSLNNFIQGAGGNDTIYGRDGHDRLNGNDGNDTLYGEAGDDFLVGSAGDDVVYGDNTDVGLPGGQDKLYGDEGNDFLSGGIFADEVFGGDGNDTLHGDEDNDTMQGGDGDDVMYGGTGSDYMIDLVGLNQLYGGTGNDVMIGGSSFDYMEGGDDDDDISGLAGGDEIFGGNGVDRIFGDEGIDYLYGGSGSDTILGGQDTDFIRGGADNDIIGGGSGIDLIFGDAGADQIDGGDDQDTVSFVESAAVTLNFTTPANNTGDAAGDTYANIELFRLSNFDDAFVGLGSTAFSVSGGAGDDQIMARQAGMVVNGGEGNDLIIITGGNNNVRGDESGGLQGLDVLALFSSPIGLTINMAPATTRDSTFTFLFNGQTQTVYGDVDAIIGGNFNDNITGNLFDNFLSGSGGDDFIYGGAGADQLEGDVGGDNLWGGQGADQHGGGDGLDFARYDDANHGNLIIRLDASNLNTGVAAGDTYAADIEGLVGGAGNDTVVGNASANYLYGSGGDDFIFGQGGADSLVGGSGTNQLYGGVGADSHVGGTGIDYARYDDANHGNLTIRLDFAGLNTGAAAGDTYTGIEGLVGGLGNDVIIGNATDNYIFGGGGADYINGLAGNDVLSGGSGADRFVFSTALNATTNVDSVRDFVHGTDDFNLAQVIFTAIGATLDATELRLGTTAADANDYLIYNSANGQLFYDANGNGAGGQTLFATVKAGTVLDITDFVMV
ncbi:MAG: calcium-binding protein [Rhizobiaceae bacterium]